MSETKGDGDMSKSTQKGRLMILSGAIIVVVAAIAWVGLSQKADNQDATGAIGAAKRHQEPQIGSGDVNLQNADLTAFMQTETFDRLMKDAELRNVVTSDAFLDLVADDTGAFARLIDDADAMGLLADADLQLLLSDEDCANKIRSQQVVADVGKKYMDAYGRISRTPKYLQLVSDAALREVVTDRKFRTLYTDQGFKTLIHNSPDFGRHRLVYIDGSSLFRNAIVNRKEFNHAVNQELDRRSRGGPVVQ